MGYVTCPAENHPWLHPGERRCCFICDRCPAEGNFRLLRGDYCPECTAMLKGKGLVWSEYHRDYAEPMHAKPATPTAVTDFFAAHPEIALANADAKRERTA